MMNWERPSAGQPLVVGLLVDVSGSMLSSIDNRAGRTLSRLESFRDSLEGLVQRARQVSLDAEGARVAPLIQVFAYGFGFGNPLAQILRRGGPDVRDLLDLGDGTPSTVAIDRLADGWSLYKAHLERLAYEMAGSTPMAAGFTEVIARMQRDAGDRGASAAPPVVFVLSDGEPTDAGPERIRALSDQLKATGTLVISCYVTDADIAEPRHLYGWAQATWPAGAALMFDVASPVPTHSPFSAYLREFKWRIDDGARLFTQVNQSEVLAEFLNLVLSPLSVDTRPSGLPLVAAVSRARDRVFVSYAHEDARWLERLQVHLRPLERDGRVDFWADTRIAPGGDWRLEIRSAISQATVAVLLISADYLASDFVATDELPSMLEAAQRDGLLVLPVIVNPSQFASMPELSRFQAVNPPDRPLAGMRPHERDEVLNKVAEVIRQRTTS